MSMSDHKIEKGWIRMHPDDDDKKYSFPDPTTEDFEDARRVARIDVDNLTWYQGQLLADAGRAYLHLLADPSGTELVLKQLRELRRALKCQ